MDHGYAIDRSPEPLPAELAKSASRVAGFIAGGGRAVVLSGDPDCGKSALVNHLLAGMPGRVLRVGGEGHGPLDLAAILAGLGRVAANEADEQGLFFRTLAELAYDDYSAVLVVEGAHRLTGFALAALARVPGLGGPDLPGILLLLSGEPMLLATLAAPGLERFRNRRRTLLVKLPETEEVRPPANMPTRLAAAALGSEPNRLGRDLRLVFLAAALGSLLTIGVMALQWPRAAAAAPADGLAGLSVIEEVVTAGVPAVSDAPVAESAPAAAAPGAGDAAPAGTVQTGAAQTGAEMADSAPAGTGLPGTGVPGTGVPGTGVPGTGVQGTGVATPEKLADATGLPPVGEAVSPQVQLRRDFDAFLDRAGRDTAKLSAPARDVLFAEYIRWRGRNVTDRAAMKP